jgi:hypothetical protein
MPKCLPREIGLVFNQVVSKGACPDFLLLQSGEVVKSNRLCNITGRDPLVGDFVVELEGKRLLMTADLFVRLFDVAAPDAFSFDLDGLVETCEFADVGPTTTCFLHLKSGPVVTGSVIDAFGNHLTEEERQELSHSDAVLQLGKFENYRMARRFAAQEQSNDQSL